MSGRSVLLLLGPNLNLLGDREPEIYGTDDARRPRGRRPGRGGRAAASSSSTSSPTTRATLVDAIHAARGRCAAIVINPGAFTHYAWAIHDALAAFDGPVVELHLSDPERPRALAPHVGGRPGGRRPPSRASGAPATRWRSPPPPTSWRLPDDRLPTFPPMDVAGPGSSACGRSSTAPAATPLLVTRLANIRYLTGFTGSAALLLVQPGPGRVRHRRPLPRAGRRAARRRRGRRRHRDPQRRAEGGRRRRAPSGVGPPRPGGRRRDLGPAARTPASGSPTPSWWPPRAWSTGSGW